MAGGEGATFFFDTNIEDVAERVRVGAKEIQSTVNGTGAATPKLTSNLDAELGELVERARVKVGELNKTLEGGGNVNLTKGYQKIVSELNQQIGKLTSGRGLTLDVGLKFAEGPIKALLADLKKQTAAAAQSQKANVRAGVGTGVIQNRKADFNTGFEVSPAEGKAYARSLKAQTAAAARSAKALTQADASDSAGALAAKSTAASRKREATARAKIADRAEKDATAAAAPAKKAVEPVRPSGLSSAQNTSLADAAAARAEANKQRDRLDAEQLIRDRSAQEGATPPPARTFTPRVRGANVDRLGIDVPAVAEEQVVAAETVQAMAAQLAAATLGARAEQRLAAVNARAADTAAERLRRFEREGPREAKGKIALGATAREQLAIGQRGDTEGSTLARQQEESAQIRLLRLITTSLQAQAEAQRASAEEVTITTGIYNQIRREVQRVLEGVRQRLAIEGRQERGQLAIGAGASQRAIGARAAGSGSDLARRSLPGEILPRNARGELVASTPQVFANVTDLPARPRPAAIGAGTPEDDPLKIRQRGKAARTAEENFANLTNNTYTELASGVIRLSKTFVADTRAGVTRIYQQLRNGFVEVEKKSTEFLSQTERLRTIQAAAPDRSQRRQNQELLSEGATREGDLGPNAKNIGGPGAAFVADIRDDETRIFKRVKGGFDEIAKGTADFEAQIRRLRAQQKAETKPGILGSFTQGFAHGGLFGQGGTDGGINGVLSGLSRSAGTSAKYALLGSALFAVQSAAAGAAQEILDFADSYTELNIALEGSGLGDANKDLQVTQSTINSLADSATLAGANVGQSMDLAAEAIRAFGDQTDGSKGALEALGVTFAAESSKIATLTKTDIADAAGNLKATALAFEVPVTNLSRVSDAIVGAKQIGGGNEKDLSQAGASAAVAAKEAGFSIEETYSLLSKIVAETDEGGQLAASRFSKITAIIGGSAGKSAITKLNDSLAPNQKIDISADVKTQVSQLSAVYGQLNEVQRQQLVNSLGGTANARELIILLQNANTLITKADQGFTGKSEEEYQKRLQDIRATLTRINGELKNIVVALSQSGVLDPFFVLIKEGLLPALELIRRIAQTFDLIPRPIRSATFALGEFLVVMKLIQAITRAGGIKAFFSGAADAVQPTRKIARELEAANIAAKEGKEAAAATGAVRAGRTATRTAEAEAFAAAHRAGSPAGQAAARAEAAAAFAGAHRAGSPAALAEAAANAPTPRVRRSVLLGAESGDVFAGVKRQSKNLAKATTDAVKEFSGTTKKIRDARINELVRTGDPKGILNNLGYLGSNAGGKPVIRRLPNGSLDDAKAIGLQIKALALGANARLRRDPQTVNPNSSQFGAPVGADAARRAAAEQARLAAIAANANQRTVRQRLSATRFQAGNLLGTFGFGSAGARRDVDHDEANLLNGLSPEEREQAIRRNPGRATGRLGRLGGSLKGAAAAIGPEAAVIGVGLSIQSSIEASNRIKDAVKQFNTLSTLQPKSFGVQELRDSAANLQEGAKTLRQASSGFFGTIVNFAQGNQTGARAKALSAEATFQKNQANALEKVTATARKGEGADLSSTIDLTSGDTLQASLDGLSGAGRNATTQFKALLGAMDAVASGATALSTNLTDVQKTTVAGKTGISLQQQLTGAATDAATANTIAGSAFGAKHVNLAAAADSALTTTSLGALPFLQTRDNGIGRLLRGGGKSKSEANFQLSKVNTTQLSQGVTDATQKFLQQGGDISSAQGAADLKAAYTTFITQHFPKLNASQVSKIASEALGDAQTAIKTLNPTDIAAASLQDILTKGAASAAAAGQEAGTAAALGRGEQGSALAQSSTELKNLKALRKRAAETGASSDQLEIFDQQIAQAKVTNIANKQTRQQGKDALALSKIAPESTTARSQATLDALDKKLNDAGYDPVTGKRKTTTGTDYSTAIDPKTGRKYARARSVQRNVGPGLEAGDRDATLAARNDAAAQQAVNIAADKASKRRSKIDPRDELANAQADLTDANDEYKRLKAANVTGKALTDAKLNVAKATQANAEQITSAAIASRNVNAIPSSSLDTATRNLADANSHLKDLKEGTIAYNQQLAAISASESELAQAKLDAKSIGRQLAIDLTNPVQVAQEAVTTAKAALAKAKKDTAGPGVDPDVRAQVVGTARLNLRTAQANEEATAFSQFLQNAQTADSLGRISHKAYLNLLKGRADQLTAELAGMNKLDPQFKQLTDQRDQLLSSIKAGADELSGVFNIGDIKTPTPYEVRKAIKDKNFGTVLGDNAATSTAGNVTNDNSTKNVVLNGVPVETILTMIQDLFGIKARTKAARKSV